MSSNRKRAAIRKAEEETERLRQMLALRDYHYNALKCISEVMAKRIEELEAAAPAALAPLTDEQIDAIAAPFLRDLGGDHWYSGERGIPEGSAPDFARAAIAASKGGAA